MKKKLFSKLFIVLASILIVSGGVLAFFVFDYNKSVDYQVGGGKGNMLVTLDLTDQSFNVSQNLSSTQDLSLVNQNGAATMFYLINTNITGVEPGCDPSGDISFELWKESTGSQVSNSTNFTMNAGLNDFNFTTIAVNNRVCDQNITVTLGFSEV